MELQPGHPLYEAAQILDSQDAHIEELATQIIELKNWKAKEELVDRIINTGLGFYGTPYLFNAHSSRTDVFDCSSFTQRLFREHGISIGRSSRAQGNIDEEERLKAEELRRGDLAFFNTGRLSAGVIDHVSLYLGDGLMLHAVPNGGVKVDKFWDRMYLWGRRVI